MRKEQSNHCNQLDFFGQIGLGLLLLDVGMDVARATDSGFRKEIGVDIKGYLNPAAFCYLWRHMAGIDRKQFTQTDAYKGFVYLFYLVCGYDDFIDENRRNGGIDRGEIRHQGKSDRYLNKVLEYVNKAGSSQPAKRRFLKDFAEFRRMELQWFKEFELSGGLDSKTFVDVVGYKERTDGLNARMFARFCHLFFPQISDNTQRCIEDRYEQVCLYFQVIDDIRDARVDYRVGTPNYLVAAAREYPTEYRELIHLFQSKNEPITSRELSQIAPQSLSLCNNRAAEYFFQANPDDSPQLRFLSKTRYVYQKFTSKIK